MYLKHCEVESRVEFIKCDIQEVIKSHTVIKKWAYILHDKDDTAPHYHIYLNFGSSGVDTKYVAEWFGLQESQVNKVKGRATDMLLYLTHGNDTQQHKYQYPTSEVISNFDFEKEIKDSKILGHFETHSYAQQLDYVHSLPPSERKSAYNTLQTLWKCHCQWLSMQTDRDISVMFITGRGGTGKTYYAKKFLREKLNFDFCISSSSNDPFQDYLGQKAIILDDLRDTAFEKLEDLLKILDNNTSSSVKSRFNNVVFNGEIIIITSSVPLCYWYLNYKGNSWDTLVQLYRRINTYVEITKEDITVYSDIDKYGKPCGAFEVYKNDLFVEDKPKKSKMNFGALFGEMCEKKENSTPFDGQAEQLKISYKKS